MPRPKPWLGRLPLILQALEALSEERLKRRDVEQIFGIGRSAANELMNVVGLAKGAGAGEPAAVTRANLLDYLTHSTEAQDAMAELARRKKLAEKLAVASDEQKLRRVAIPVSSADEWCTLAELPNVTIEDGVLRVAFSSPRELMADLYRLAKAAGNDWDAFERVCGGKPQ